MPLKVLFALDTARTQFYHFKAIFIAGMGLFTDAYDLFCIPPVMALLKHIYYGDEHHNYTVVASTMVGIALLGAVIGNLVLGRQGDIRGRRSIYGFTLTLMVLSSMGCGFSVCRTKNCVLFSLGFFRFLLGIGIGGDYPLSATIMSEFANKRIRGALMAAMFSMQGWGILFSSTVTIIVCKCFEAASKDLTKHHAPEDADIAWRLILMLGAIPAALTYYWRMMMPETARYTGLVANDVQQAAKDMMKVLDVPMSRIEEDQPLSPGNQSSYPLLSKQFFRRHGRDLFSCAATWFLLDIAFYSSILSQSHIYNSFVKTERAKNVYEEAIRIAYFQAIVAICSTIPGYWFTVYFVDRIGRRKIQKMGFLCMGVAYFALALPYSYWHKHKNVAFLVLFCLTLFFANFGPNTTTFMVPAELFPARLRSTCHGISGAMGKVGALIGALGFIWASDDRGSEDHSPKSKPMTVALAILGGVCLVGLVVTCFTMRETMGRSLEENEKEEEEGASISSFGFFSNATVTPNSRGLQP
uniref:Inorganic phosphate transporter n=2 Tax=Rhizophora mucronata TaxID=61149 RepID=A0A2P2IT41_RHIMU